MRRRTLVVIVALALLVLGGGAALVACDQLFFRCPDDASCVRDGHAGRCLASPWSSARYCTFSAADCPSLERWDPTAGEGLAGTCVERAASPDGSASDGGTSDGGSPDGGTSDGGADLAPIRDGAAHD